MEIDEAEAMANDEYEMVIQAAEPTGQGWARLAHRSHSTSGRPTSPVRARPVCVLDTWNARQHTSAMQSDAGSAPVVLLRRARKEDADAMSMTRLRATATAHTTSDTSSGWMRRRSCTLA